MERPLKLVLAKSCIKILYNLGFWAYEKRTILFFVRIYICLIFYRLADVGLFGYIRWYMSFNKFNLADLSDDICGFSAHSAVFVALNFHLLNQPKYAEILNDLGDFSQYEEPLNIRRLNKQINVIIELVLTWCYIVVLGIWGYYSTRTCVEGQVDGCGLPVLLYMPYDIFHWPMRQVTNTFICVLVLHQGIAAFIFPCVLAIICEFLVNRIDHLKILLSRLPNMKRQSRKAHVRKCIQYHHKIIEIADKFYDTTYAFLFYWVPITSLIMTLILYQVIVNFKLSLFIHCLMWVTNIILICVAGERLRSSSIELEYVAYDSVPWDGDLQTQKALLLLMMRCNKPLEISAGFMGYCSNVCLMSVFSTSYRIITLLIDVE